MKAILTFVNESDEGSWAGEEIEFDALRQVPVFKAVRDGKAFMLPVNIAEYDAKVLCHALDYGLKQLANDATASVKVGEADTYEKALAAVAKRFDAFAKGEVRTNAGGVRIDAVAREALDMAEADVRQWYKAQGKKITGADDAIEAIAKDCVRDSLTPKGRHFDYMVNAKAIIELRRNRDSDEDLDVTP
jgi:hypothetical protein